MTPHSRADQGPQSSQRVAVVGASGAVGSELVRLLACAGHSVQPIARSAGIRLDDEDALRHTFAKADAAFVMVPFDRQSNDLHAYEQRAVERLATAIEQSNVQRVVALSGTSASLGIESAGSGAGAAMLEERLSLLELPEFAILRAAYHMENLLPAFDEIRKSGTFHAPFASDRPMPMVAAKDVAQAAFDIIVAEQVGLPVTRELLGYAEYTMDEASHMIGSALGRPGHYAQVDFDTAIDAMVASGMSQDFAMAVAETARSFNSGATWQRESRGPGNTSCTSLNAFCAQIASKHEEI